MPPPRRVVTHEERQHVPIAYESGDDVAHRAKYNNMSRAATYRLCKAGDLSPPIRGGARASFVKYTDGVVDAMEANLDIDRILTLTHLANKVQEDSVSSYPRRQSAPSWW
ncbi:unnamed protein product [Phytophthora fragariaefolia]|uniref:Unnamed protein product n=1 Tax=Phytophthora fragariaefolia TaxID=1490495 RepID=A0A9W6XVT5_9STRA|nr:unnamed protein product [Phytophthora fragariaefolia]